MTQEQKDQTKNILTRLKNDGYVGVALAFDGAGDSGSFNASCIYTSDDGFDLDNEYHDIFSDDEAGLYDLGYEAVRSTGNDWYNNDGGYGCVNICLLTGNIKVHMYIRVYETEYYGNDYKAIEFTK